MCTSNRNNCCPERMVKQRPFKNIWGLHKWSEAGVSASRATMHRCAGHGLLQLPHSLCEATPEPEKMSKASYLGQENWSVTQSSVALFIRKSRSQSLEIEWRGTESKLREDSSVSDDLGRHVIFWCWSTVFNQVQSQHSCLPGHFRALHASFCSQASWRC